MGTMVIISMGIAASGLLTVLTGWWRAVFRPFGLNPRRMTVRRLGLLVRESDVERIEGIFESFAGGFNAMIAGPSANAWRDYCESLPAFNQPFAHEGAAMGYTLRRLFRYRAEDFEASIVSRRSEFRYLYYVGLGFWWGIRNFPPVRVEKRAEKLDPLYRYLCFDGYGFKRAFFDHPKDPRALDSLHEFSGYARSAAYHGVGRALWFRFMAEPSVLVDRLKELGGYATDAAAGVGLASVFVHPDRLRVAQNLGRLLPSEWHAHFHLGMCFGLKARSINDPRKFTEDLGGMSDDVGEAVAASIRECDRVEHDVRAGCREEGYRHWRERVTAWMAENIQYPMMGLKDAPARTQNVGDQENQRGIRERRAPAVV